MALLLHKLAVHKKCYWYAKENKLRHGEFITCNNNNQIAIRHTFLLLATTLIITSLIQSQHCIAWTMHIPYPYTVHLTPTTDHLTTLGKVPTKDRDADMDTHSASPATTKTTSHCLIGDLSTTLSTGSSGS